MFVSPVAIEPVEVYICFHQSFQFTSLATADGPQVSQFDDSHAYFKATVERMVMTG
jgi:hypothetical protein